MIDQMLNMSYNDETSYKYEKNKEFTQRNHYRHKETGLKQYIFSKQFLKKQNNGKHILEKAEKN